jgi:hypothetical protein
VSQTYQDLEIRLTKPLIANQQIRVKYRTSINGAWTTINTLDTTNTKPNETTIYTKALIGNASNVQLRCELSQPTSVVFPNNIEVIELRLR